LQHLSQLLNGLGLIPLGLERCLNVKLCHRSNSIRLLYAFSMMTDLARSGGALGCQPINFLPP